MSRRKKRWVGVPTWRRRATKFFAYSLIIVVGGTAFFTAGTDFSDNVNSEPQLPAHIAGRAVIDEPVIYTAGKAACMSLEDHGLLLAELTNPPQGEHWFYRVQKHDSDNVPEGWSLLAVVNMPEILCIAWNEHFDPNGLKGADDSQPVDPGTTL